ncbi:MAG TPA: hypothetical protein VMV49_17230 [Candidatus Deferrimicrobium sp.]|nr:hypothetical protein [Candidatus Deferrimicrobium sp.]
MVRSSRYFWFLQRKYSEKDVSEFIKQNLSADKFEKQKIEY